MLAALRAPSAASARTFSTSALRGAPKPGKAIVSSLQAGTKMEGLSVFKDVPDPVSLPEDQYPKWLWTLLDKPKGQPVAAPGERNFLAERKAMRDRNRANIKATNFMKTT
ncbi:hypothetical protein CC85DRAFT_327934 [Cutaneotrichosporon oleaginosum]|uniref:Large ribosomal subunit protein mL54 n=1 Tax=Cutaneotrichosporon oleaginosum TaxID=879819 RepID=A0A0J0XNJ5_9TREE|nr:uncharacterized protein CC85DRAFT_327934 [Cutaneotrichosporon oleaginosum]KLT42696.1 hypothetical protein CC85DRAFT_327934 [Cutaneotrichosporon oleaginosum]TXT09585.1 hypothetical protein COLE_03519 [Cutaneotrichosporon oleaginosum]